MALVDLPSLADAIPSPPAGALSPSDEALSPSVPRLEDGLRRRALAEFLRSRRERLSPLDVGLPQGGRRRTPGLRREEVAQLAGVGVTWYTWLEQSRDIRVSEQVLDAIARGLLLDAQERDHLFTLAGAPSVAAAGECQGVSSPVLQLVEQVSPFPAAVINGRYDILAYNQAYAGLVGDLDALGVAERNNLWLLFTSPVLRARVVDWETTVARCVAQFRASYAEHMTEPAWKCLPRRLAEESPAFTSIWARQDVAAVEMMTKRYRHPELGLLSFQTAPLWLRQRSESRLVVYTPADAETAERVAQLETVVPSPLDARPR